jgi:hypothetical protein
MSVMETLTFRLAADTDEAAFLDADRRVQTGFSYRQPGLVRRTTARGQHGDWIVVVLWQSAGDADAAARRADTDRACSELVALLDETTVESRRYSMLD